MSSPQRSKSLEHLDSMPVIMKRSSSEGNLVSCKKEEKVWNGRAIKKMDHPYTWLTASFVTFSTLVLVAISVTITEEEQKKRSYSQRAFDWSAFLITSLFLLFSLSKISSSADRLKK